MKRTVIIATFLLLTAYALFAQTPLQVPKPGPEHQRLHYYVGDWKTEAEAKPSPFGAGGKMTVTNHNEMLGDFYVVFHGDGTGPTGPIKTLAAIGYDTKQKAYTFDEFTSTGEHAQATGTVAGDTWIWTFDGEAGGKSFKGRFTLKEVSPTSYTFTNELSIDGGPWAKLEEGKATKAK
jgi:uncharacterized protein DUF1579